MQYKKSMESLKAILKDESKDESDRTWVFETGIDDIFQQHEELEPPVSLNQHSIYDSNWFPRPAGQSFSRLGKTIDCNDNTLLNSALSGAKKINFFADKKISQRKFAVPTLAERNRRNKEKLSSIRFDTLRKSILPDARHWNTNTHVIDFGPAQPPPQGSPNIQLARRDFRTGKNPTARLQEKLNRIRHALENNPEEVKEISNILRSLTAKEANTTAAKGGTTANNKHVKSPGSSKTRPGELSDDATIEESKEHETVETAQDESKSRDPETSELESKEPDMDNLGDEDQCAQAESKQVDVEAPESSNE